jgi:hypothetical protein
MYPPALRIEASDPETGLLILEIASIQERLAKLPAQPVAAMAATPDVVHGLAVGICNQMLRLERSANKARQQGSAEAERLQGHLERTKSTLAESGIKYEDLTGQAYDPGRYDFEPLGEPQISPDVTRATIIQCERPVVMLNGKLVQKAKGVVGIPAH